MNVQDRIRKALSLCNEFTERELGTTPRKQYCRHAWQKTDSRPMKELRATESSIEFACATCGKTKQHTFPTYD